MTEKLSIPIVFGLVALFLAVSAVFAAGREPSSLRYFEDGHPAGGVSLLSRDGENGQVSSMINATHLMPGAAYTYWWVVFNNPQNCSAPGCGEDDLFNEDGTLNVAQINAVGISVLGGNGEIANRGGRATFTGTLMEGDAGELDVVIGPGGIFDFPWLLEDALTAEIHIVVRNHGPALSGAALEGQLTTFAGNCIGLDPDGTFMCADEQFAVHMP
ncbi:MAG: hypothetical protein HY532_01425 [Chloroflexi bacterium]|nr:hypothetical protein [Chloroflexota bacterium]